MTKQKYIKGDINYNKWLPTVDFIGVKDPEKRDWLINYLQSMEENKKDIIGSNFVVFAAGNEYKYGQDMQSWIGIPSNIKFFPLEELPNDTIIFIADGFGILPKYKLAGKYGNGAIFVKKSEISHLLEWCKENYIIKS